MTWLSRIAIFFGRTKFEEFAQANPELPDDALAIANSLDTYPVRGAVTLIAGSLAHAVDNVLRGSETVGQLATHALLVLAGLCIIWVRHAISKHDVAVNAAVQKARDVAGLPRTVTAIIVAFGFLVAQASLPVVSNCRAGTPTPPTGFDLLTQLLSDIGQSARFSSGVGMNLHAKIAPLLSQELALFGHSGTNSSWTTGPSHATFFLTAVNEEELGWSFSGRWKSPPRLLRFALFNARDVEWTVNWGLPVEDYYTGFRHADWKENRFGASVTRKF